MCPGLTCEALDKSRASPHNEVEKHSLRDLAFAKLRWACRLRPQNRSSEPSSTCHVEAPLTEKPTRERAFLAYEDRFADLP